MGDGVLRVVDENVKTTAGELGDLVLALDDALGLCHLEGKDADAGSLEILDHVGVSHRGDDMTACGA